MKKTILTICYYINAALLILVLLLLIAVLFNFNGILDYVLSESFLNMRMLVNIPIIILWIFNMVFWSKHDKNIGRFFLLFFLNAFYNPFYYRRVLKNKWI